MPVKYSGERSLPAPSSPTWLDDGKSGFRQILDYSFKNRQSQEQVAEEQTSACAEKFSPIRPVVHIGGLW